MEQRYSISFYGQVIFPGGLTYSMYIISMREIPTESHSAGGNVRFMYTRRYLSLTFVKCSRREMSRFSFLQNVRAGQACCENVLSLSPSPEIERRLYDRFFDNDKARDRTTRETIRGRNGFLLNSKKRKVGKATWRTLAALVRHDWPARLHPFTVRSAATNGKRAAALLRVRPMGT